MGKFKFFGISIVILIILLIVWFFSCFLLGYASNSENHQREIWMLYVVTVLVHFLIIRIIYKKWFSQSLNTGYMLINILMYIVGAWYFYYNS